MATDRVYDGEEPDNQENVILRSIVGNPNRHKPLAQHTPPTITMTTPTGQDDIPASMYTLETRHRPIPAKVLPKSTASSRLPSSNNAEQSPVTKEEEEEDTPLYVEPNIIHHVREEPEPTVFLEPKIISQPILYSIVGAKTLPVGNEQPMPFEEKTPQAVFYTVTGQPNRPTIDMSTITLNVAKPIIDKSPFLYSLVGGPRLHVRIQEPIKEKSEEQSPPLLHSVVGNPKLTPGITPLDSPDVPPSKQVQAESILYTIVGDTQVPKNMPVQTRAPVKKQTNTHVPVSLHQATKISPTRPTPILYTIVGDSQVPVNMHKKQPIVPAPIKKQANPFISIPLTQSVEYSPVQPVPVLYTIVGETEVPNNITKEDRSPTTPVKKHTNGIHVYQVVGKTQQPTQPVKQAPSFYPLIGNPDSPSEENMVVHPKLQLRRSTPPRTIVPIRRISRSLDRQTAPQSSTGGSLSPPKQNRRRAKSREPTIPKSETVFIPLSEEERLPPIKHPRNIRRKRSAGYIHRKNFTIEQYGPVELSNYISPYAYRPSEPYRERTYKHSPFPTTRHPRSEYRMIQSSYAPYYRGERKRPHHLSTPLSLERDLSNTRRSDRLWDYEDTAQTDYDDDDLSNVDSSRKRSRHRRFRPRTPWIPVW